MFNTEKSAREVSSFILCSILLGISLKLKDGLRLEVEVSWGGTPLLAHAGETLFVRNPH